MGGSKKRKLDEEPSFKRKKLRAKNNSDMDPEPTVEDTNSESFTAELLSNQTIREGMLLLGCVKDVKTTSIIVSLPGYLTGVIPANNISDPFTKAQSDTTYSSDFEDTDLSIDSIIRVGMVFPCKVIEISKDPSQSKSTIILSINPQEVNADLKPSSIYPKMVLFVSVCSVEDHGYIVDVGAKCIQGFLPKKHSEDESKGLRVGAVIPTYVKKVTFSDKLSAKIQLSKLDFSDEFPEVACEDIKLPSLLPGARIPVDVIEVRHPFVFMKYLYFDACASLLSLNRTHKSIKIGGTVLGTVLYVHPITHMIYIMLGPKPSPDTFAGYFGFRRFESVQNLTFQSLYMNRVYYKINKHTNGFISRKDLPDKGCDAGSVSNNISKACVLYFHYMDNLVQLTAKKSMVEQKIILPEDVQIGDIYEAIVKKHFADGMLVCLCPGLFGFVRDIHLSDVFVTKPELLHPIGSKVKCRVLSTDGKGKINLTCKETLVNLQEHYILSSYDVVQCGQFYKGVIVKKTDTYILVLFFNNVRGIVSANEIPSDSVYYEGQTVLCEVLESIPSKKKLKLSLRTIGWCSIEEIDMWDDMYSSNEEGPTSRKKVKSLEVPTSGKKVKSLEVPTSGKKVKSLEVPTSEKKVKLLTPKSTKTDTGSTKLVEKVMKLLSKESCEIVNNGGSDCISPVKAVITKVKGGQLNILLNESKGRVHITELGCVSEGIHPLKEFSPGQVIEVYVIGEHEGKRFLKVTSRGVLFKECSLTFPPMSSKSLEPGTSVIGFVKKLGSVSAVIWLSPTETGVLDYLHFSENPKELKKVHQYLKKGLSINVSIIENEKHAVKEGSTHSFSLTKIGKKIPQVGKNILGLVQIGCLDRGLVLKLPFGYHGVAAITDLTDIYAPVQSLFDKCRRLKYVLCHILDVNHQTKYCQVSLRKSRVYNKKDSSADFFCPEILPNNVKEGDTVKGFVKSVSNIELCVVFGRNLEGKVSVHSCSVTDCNACIASKDIHSKYPVGSVVKVDVEKIGVDGKSFTLVLGDSRNFVTSRYNRLSIKEDISWDELE